MDSLGQYLKRERELRDVSIDSIVQATKISRSYIEAIESDNFKRLPGQTFIVGFLRLYSNYVGLDSNEVVNRYLDFLNKTEEVPQPQTTLEKNTNNNLIYLSIIGISSIIIIAIIIYYIYSF